MASTCRIGSCKQFGRYAQCRRPMWCAVRGISAAPGLPGALACSRPGSRGACCGAWAMAYTARAWWRQRPRARAERLEEESGSLREEVGLKGKGVERLADAVRKLEERAAAVVAGASVDGGEGARQCWLRSWLMLQLHTHRLHLPLLSTHSPLCTRQLLHHHSRHLPTFPTTTHQLP